MEIYYILYRRNIFINRILKISLFENSIICISNIKSMFHGQKQIKEIINYLIFYEIDVFLFIIVFLKIKIKRKDRQSSSSSSSNVYSKVFRYNSKISTFSHS